MSRAQFLAAATVVALGYMAANTVEAGLADLTRLPELINTAVSVFINIPAGIVLLLLFFGGLPLAVFGLMSECPWMGIALERRRHLHVPYSVLMFQIVSMVYSTLWLVVMGPDLLWALGYEMTGLPALISGYLGLQILASLAVIPVWRRLMANTIVPPTESALRP